MSEAYTWTKKMSPNPTKATGFDSISTSDSKRQMERLRADNAELTKTVIDLRSQLRELTDAVKSLQKKPAKKEEAPPAQA